MKCMKILTGFLALLLTASFSAFAQDPGWPRKLEKPGGTVIAYQPQVDDWKDFTNITWREAFQMTPRGGKQVIGAATFAGTTNVDSDKHTVVIYGIKVSQTYFPSLDEPTSAKMDQLFKTFVPEVVNISLERVVAYIPKPESVQEVNLKNDPPFIFVNYSPAILLAVDGEPDFAAIPKTKLKFVVNTQWAVFWDTSKSQYYLLVGQHWLTASDLHGPWSAATTLPKDMEKLPDGSSMDGFEESDSAAYAIQRPNSKSFLQHCPGRGHSLQRKTGLRKDSADSASLRHQHGQCVLSVHAHERILLSSRGALVPFQGHAGQMDIRFRGSAGRLCQDSTIQSCQRHIVLRAGNGRSQKRSTNRTDTHCYGD